MDESTFVFHHRSAIRLRPVAGAVEWAHELVGKSIRHPDSASSPEGALVEFEGVVL